jgi:hypothetical protein
VTYDEDGTISRIREQLKIHSNDALRVVSGKP